MPLSTFSGGDSQHLGTYAWASLPPASGNEGKTIFCSDVAGGILVMSNGTRWRSLSNSPIMLAQACVPSILPSSGTIGNNGAWSGITALPATFTKGYAYFPANAIYAGSAAGSYYVEMSSPTAGVIYNNVYTSGIPARPASPTPFVTTGPGAYTQTTGAEITLLSIPVLGGLLGKNGVLMGLPGFLYANSANQKTIKAKLGDTAFFSINATTTTGDVRVLVIQNMDSESAQICMLNAAGVSGIGTMNGTPTIGAENTAADLNYTQTGQLANASDFIIATLGELSVRPG